MPLASTTVQLAGTAALPTAVILPDCMMTLPVWVLPWVMVRSLPPVIAMQGDGLETSIMGACAWSWADTEMSADARNPAKVAFGDAHVSDDETVANMGHPELW